MTPVWASAMIATWAALFLLAFLLLGALRQIGLLQLRLGQDPGGLLTDDGLDRGAVAPGFPMVALETGETHYLDHLSAEARVLVFVSTGCIACKEYLPHVNEVAKTRPEYDFAIICAGDLDSCRQFLRANKVRQRAFVDVSGAATSLYEIPGTPFTYVLDHRRRVLARGIANDWRGLESLIQQEGTLQGGRSWEVDGRQEAGATEDLGYGKS